jgi:hypothetical protein
LDESGVVKLASRLRMEGFDDAAEEFERALETLRRNRGARRARPVR